MGPQQIEARLQYILPRVQKAGRYTGGELNQVVKDWQQTPIRVALAFPDLYDLGMSNLGLAVLYDTLSQQPDMLAERVYAPWTDMEAAMRRQGVPLFSLETKHPLADFDILGFSLPYETLYTNALNMLDLAGLPVRSSERSTANPLVIAGGHAAYNPEPMAEFIDAFAVGEGEEMILDIAHCVGRWKARRGSRQELLLELAGIGGVYVPSLYHPHYHLDSTLCHIEALDPRVPARVRKRILAKLPPPPTRLVVPYIQTAQDRYPVEIMRGCTRGCRFCQAGMVNRPLRERPVNEVIGSMEKGLSETGFGEASLLSLSSSDYSRISERVRQAVDRFRAHRLDLSLPSLRIDSFSLELLELLEGHAHRGGFTLAPEAATERMRQVINKPLSDGQLLDIARQIYARGWHTIKLYFMIGHPSETLEDVEAIADLCLEVLAEGRKAMGRRAKVHVAVSTFIPKPHTPFQWVPCDTVEQIRDKQALLRRRLHGPGLKLGWTQPEETMLEAWLSRGDRRLGQVIHEAWRQGARFDAWQEHFNYEAWVQAFQTAGLDPAFYTHRERSLDEVLPWDVIDTGLAKEFLAEDYLASLLGRTRPDCRQQCYACGILTAFADLRRVRPRPTWGCRKPRSSSRKRDAETLPVPAANER